MHSPEPTIRIRPLSFCTRLNTATASPETVRSRKLKSLQSEHLEYKKRAISLMDQCEDYSSSVKKQEHSLFYMTSQINQDADSYIKSIHRALKGPKKEIKLDIQPDREYRIPELKQITFSKHSQTEWLQQSEKLHNYLEHQILQSTREKFNGNANSSAEKYKNKVSISGYLQNPMIYTSMIGKLRRKKMAQIAQRQRQLRCSENKRAIMQ